MKSTWAISMFFAIRIPTLLSSSPTFSSLFLLLLKFLKKTCCPSCPSPDLIPDGLWFPPPVVSINSFIAFFSAERITWRSPTQGTQSHLQSPHLLVHLARIFAALPAYITYGAFFHGKTWKCFVQIKPGKPHCMGFGGRLGFDVSHKKVAEKRERHRIRAGINFSLWDGMTAVVCSVWMFM